MAQTLRYTFASGHHARARFALAPVRSYPLLHSLESLLVALQHFIAQARKDLLQPRQQVIDRILREAALLR